MRRNMKVLLWVFTFAVILITLYWISYDWKEWFSGANVLFSIIERLSVAYLVSFMFFCIIEFLPYRRKRKWSENKRIESVYRVIGNASELLRCLFKIANIQFDESNFNICVFDGEFERNDITFDFTLTPQYAYCYNRKH